MPGRSKPTTSEKMDKPISPRETNRQSEFLRQILDINPNLIFAKDREGRFTLVNQAVAEIYGTTTDDLIGKTDADFNPNRNEVEFFRRMDLQVMDTLREVVIPEEVITDAKGQLHWLQTVKRPIIGPDGRADQVLGVASDITHHKRLEEQLRHAQKLEALGHLAGGLAHDFNNMLAVILGNAERLRERSRRAEIKDQSLITGLDLILDSCERAATLVRRLLTFARRKPSRPTVLDLNAGIRDMTALLQRSLGEGMEFRVCLCEPEARIRIDPVELEQVIINLAVNARDAMPAGGVFEITTALESIDSPLSTHEHGPPSGRYVKLTVSDTGTGMTPEVARRVFEPMFTTKPAGKGTGFGLAIVYGIIKRAGGFISLDSMPGKGTTFTMLFPQVE
jgi:two-component system cell cycle sensor histidine kinase/response regulator CckA